MKVHVERQEEETVATSSLLRFNILSRRSTILNSKGSKNKKSHGIPYGRIQQDGNQFR